MIRIKLFSLSALFLVLAFGTARAQMPNASQQVDSDQQRRQLESSANFPASTNAAPEFYQGETSDIGPQSVLRFKPHRTYFEALADEQYFFTDNAFLAEHGKQNADVLVSTVQAALAPTPYEFAGGSLALRLGYQHQWFNYGLAGSETVNVYDFTTFTYQQVPIDTFDFNVSTVFADAAWQWQNWTFTLGGDFRQLLGSGNYDEFYRELVPRWSVRREFTIDQTLAFSIGYEGDYRSTKTVLPPPSFTDEFNDRMDNSLEFVGSLRLCRYAILQPFYRFQYTHYTRINRDDFLSSIGLTLYCPITKQITIRTFMGYDVMNTDGLFAQDYRKLDAGAGLNLTVRF